MIEKELASYPEDVQWRFQRADGYLDLGMVDHAHRELDRIPESFLQGMVYNEFLLRLFFAEEDWSGAGRLAEELVETHPINAEYWIKFAYARRRSRSLDEAERILTNALRHCPDEPMIHYNLACYACVRGDKERAVKLLRKLMLSHSWVAELALDDEDLSPIVDML